MTDHTARTFPPIRGASRSDIHIINEYPRQPEKVWRALTDPALIPLWTREGLGGRAEGFVAVTGTKFRFVAKPQPWWRGFVDCEVIEVRAPSLLRYSWVGDEVDSPTLVAYQLEPIRGERASRLIIRDSAASAGLSCRGYCAGFGRRCSGSVFRPCSTLSTIERRALRARSSKEKEQGLKLSMRRTVVAAAVLTLVLLPSSRSSAVAPRTGSITVLVAGRWPSRLRTVQLCQELPVRRGRGIAKTFLSHRQ